MIDDTTLRIIGLLVLFGSETASLLLYLRRRRIRARHMRRYLDTVATVEADACIIEMFTRCLPPRHSPELPEAIYPMLPAPREESDQWTC